MASWPRNPLCSTVFTLLILTSILQVVLSACNYKNRRSCRKKFSAKELRNRLSALQYQVTQERGTERPFSGSLLTNTQEGEYDCGVCEEPLFSSAKKFDAGTGWPSFSDAISPNAITVMQETFAGKQRNEASCGGCGSHLGELFEEGSGAGKKKRFSINSAALKFKASKKALQKGSKKLRKIRKRVPAP